ncbi:hypothetical protein D9M71_806330 [compost metagenome]
MPGFVEQFADNLGAAVDIRRFELVEVAVQAAGLVLIYRGVVVMVVNLEATKADGLLDRLPIDSQLFHIGSLSGCS